MRLAGVGGQSTSSKVETKTDIPSSQHGKNEEEPGCYRRQPRSDTQTKKKSRSKQLKQFCCENTGRDSTSVPMPTVPSQRDARSITTINKSNSSPLECTDARTRLNHLTNSGQDKLLQAAMFGSKRVPGRGKSSFLHAHMNVTQTPS